MHLTHKFSFERLEDRILLAGNLTFLGLQDMGMGPMAVFESNNEAISIDITRAENNNLVFDGTENGTTITIGQVSSTLVELTEFQTQFVDDNDVHLVFMAENSTGINVDVQDDLPGGIGIMGSNFGDDTLNVSDGGVIDGLVMFRGQRGSDTVDVNDGGVIIGNVMAELGVINGRQSDADGDHLILEGFVGGDVNFEAGGGDNSFISAEGTLDGNLVFNAGQGRDTFTFDSLNIIENAQVTGDVLLNLGDGNNSIFVGATGSIISGSIDGNLTVNTGDGEDFATLDARIGENVRYSLGDGHNKVEGDDGVVSGSVVINGGVDVDEIGLDSVRVGQLNVSTSLTIDVGEGDDDVTLDNVTALGDTLIDVGNGENTVLVEGVFGDTVLDTFSILSGDGNDSITLFQSFFDNVNVTIESNGGNDNISTSFTILNGQLSILAGDNRDIVILSFVTFDGEIQIDTGSSGALSEGADLVAVLEVGVSANPSPDSTNSVEILSQGHLQFGANGVELTPGNTTGDDSERAFSITQTGAFASTIDMRQVSVATLNVELGAGNDEMDFSNGDFETANLQFGDDQDMLLFDNLDGDFIFGVDMGAGIDTFSSTMPIPTGSSLFNAEEIVELFM